MRLVAAPLTTLTLLKLEQVEPPILGLLGFVLELQKLRRRQVGSTLGDRLNLWLYESRRCFWFWITFRLNHAASGSRAGSVASFWFWALIQALAA